MSRRRCEAGGPYNLPVPDLPPHLVLVTLPAGTKAVKIPGLCNPSDEPGRYRCGSWQRWVEEDYTAPLTFTLKVEKAVPGAKGTVALTGEPRPFDKNPANDTLRSCSTWRTAARRRAVPAAAPARPPAVRVVPVVPPVPAGRPRPAPARPRSGAAPRRRRAARGRRPAAATWRRPAPVRPCLSPALPQQRWPRAAAWSSRCAVAGPSGSSGPAGSQPNTATMRRTHVRSSGIWGQACSVGRGAGKRSGRGASWHGHSPWSRPSRR